MSPLQSYFIYTGPHSWNEHNEFLCKSYVKQFWRTFSDSWKSLYFLRTQAPPAVRFQKSTMYFFQLAKNVLVDTQKCIIFIVRHMARNNLRSMLTVNERARAPNFHTYTDKYQIWCLWIVVNPREVFGKVRFACKVLDMILLHEWSPFSLSLTFF